MSNRFILIEGLDATGKSTLVTNLMESLNAKVIRNPPNMIDERITEDDLRSYFDSVGGTRRREFYRSANFISSEMARSTLDNHWVVMDRYWPSTAAFAAMDTHPMAWEALGIYPVGFLQPDFTFLLTVSEEERSKRLIGRGIGQTEEETRMFANRESRENVLQGLLAFSPVVIDTTNMHPDDVAYYVLNHLRDAGECINNGLHCTKKQ